MTDMVVPQAARDAALAAFTKHRLAQVNPGPPEGSWKCVCGHIFPEGYKPGSGHEQMRPHVLDAILDAAFAEVKVLTETATRVASELALKLGRAEALEEAAAKADWLAEGVANPEKPYNEAFIHACGVVARHIRGMASQAPQAASDATSGVPGHPEVSEAVRSPQEPGEGS